MNTEIKKYAYFKIGTDAEPYEVLQVLSPKKVIVRAMKSTLTKSPSYELGGFVAHFENYEQKWKIESDPTQEEVQITLTKKGWSYGRFIMTDTPVKFYDFNF